MKLLEKTQIEKELVELPGWKLEGNCITKQYHFGNFKSAFAAMTAIAFEAESFNHHPDWSNAYSKLDIQLTTHDSGGITEKDIQLANRIETICSKLIDLK